MFLFYVNGVIIIIIFGRIVKVLQASSLQHFWRFSFFAHKHKERTSKKSFDFLERGKTYAILLQNFVLFYMKYVLTRYSKVRKKTKFRTFLNNLFFYYKIYALLGIRKILPNENLVGFRFNYLALLIKS